MVERAPPRPVHSVAMNVGHPPGGGEFGAGHHRGISLLSGWLPVTVQLVVVLLLLVAIGWRTRRWRVL